jgi:hypothetical protein
VKKVHHGTNSPQERKSRLPRRRSHNTRVLPHYIVEEKESLTLSHFMDNVSALLSSIKFM